MWMPDKVVVALVGTKLYPSTGEPFEIKKAKIRVESVGMICAEDEIGSVLLMHYGAGWKYGSRLQASFLFGVENDYVIEIGLTPNRTDAFSQVLPAI